MTRWKEAKNRPIYRRRLLEFIAVRDRVTSYRTVLFIIAVSKKFLVGI